MDALESPPVLPGNSFMLRTYHGLNIPKLGFAVTALLDHAPSPCRAELGIDVSLVRRDNRHGFQQVEHEQ